MPQMVPLMIVPQTHIRINSVELQTPFRRKFAMQNESNDDDVWNPKAFTRDWWVKSQVEAAASNSSPSTDWSHFFNGAAAIRSTASAFQSPTSLPTTAGYVCTVLGILSILLNVYVAIAVLANRRHSLKNVFYIIVMHCALIDLVRGVCLVVWAVPFLDVDYSLWQRTMLIRVMLQEFVGHFSFFR